MKLTEREHLMLGLVLEKLSKSEGAVELDFVAKRMKYVKPVHHEQTEEMRRNHAKFVLRMLTTKLAANGITFGRTTTLGRGNKAQYDFERKEDRTAAKRLYAKQTFEKA
jgi:hypothetical protein